MDCAASVMGMLRILNLSSKSASWVRDNAPRGNGPAVKTKSPLC
jgi:hypothetical protein